MISGCSLDDRLCVSRMLRFFLIVVARLFSDDDLPLSTVPAVELADLSDSSDARVRARATADSVTAISSACVDGGGRGDETRSLVRENDLLRRVLVARDRCSI